MFKKRIRKKAESLATAVGGAALLIGSYLIMAAANRYLEKREK